MLISDDELLDKFVWELNFSEAMLMSERCYEAISHYGRV
jgi:hypothetical protein